MWLKSEVLGIKSGDANQRSIGAGLPEGSEDGGFLKGDFLSTGEDSGKALVAGEVEVGHVAG
jgi:hypothetical protein